MKFIDAYKNRKAMSVWMLCSVLLLTFNSQRFFYALRRHIICFSINLSISDLLVTDNRLYNNVQVRKFTC